MEENRTNKLRKKKEVAKQGKRKVRRLNWKEWVDSCGNWVEAARSSGRLLEEGGG